MIERNPLDFRSKLELEFAPSIIDELLEAGYSCSETTFRALCQIFDVPFNVTMLRATSTLRGGANVGWMCGVLITSIAFIPLLIERLKKAGVGKLESELLACSLTVEFRCGFGACDCTTIWERVEGTEDNFPGNSKAHCVVKEGVLLVVNKIDEFLKANSI